MTMSNRLMEKKRDDGSVIYHVDRQKRTGQYFVTKDGSRSQADYLASIRLEGFDRLPSGLYRDGYGFTSGGAWIVSSLGRKFGTKLRVTLSTTQPPSVKDANGLTHVVINHNRLAAVNGVVRRIKKDR